MATYARGDHYGEGEGDLVCWRCHGRFNTENAKKHSGSRGFMINDFDVFVCPHCAALNQLNCARARLHTVYNQAVEDALLGHNRKR